MAASKGVIIWNVELLFSCSWSLLLLKGVKINEFVSYNMSEQNNDLVGKFWF